MSIKNTKSDKREKNIQLKKKSLVKNIAKTTVIASNNNHSNDTKKKNIVAIATKKKIKVNRCKQKLCINKCNCNINGNHVAKAVITKTSSREKIEKKPNTAIKIDNNLSKMDKKIANKAIKKNKTLSVKQTENKIAIIGAGAFGCAIYSAIRDVKDNNISIFFKEKKQYAYALKRKKHSKMNINFNKNTLLTNKLVYAVKNRKYVFLSSPFSVACNVVHDIQKIIGKKAKITIIICCKGMLAHKPFWLYDFIKKELPNASIAVLSGPSFADEMIKKNKTIVNISCENKSDFDEISSIFDSSFVTLKHNDNPKAIEMLGAIKNIMAIYAGYYSVANNSSNEAVKNILDCIEDTKKLFKKMKFKADILLEPAGIGDVILTCLYGKSRNRTFGELLAKKPKKAFKFLKKTTVEGYEALNAILAYCEYINIHLPSFEKLSKIINLNKENNEQ